MIQRKLYAEIIFLMENENKQFRRTLRDLQTSTNLPHDKYSLSHAHLQQNIYW